MREATYTIEATDTAIEVRGTLTLEQASDILSFYQSQGFTTLEDWGDRTTFYITRRNIDEERRELINKDTLEYLENVKDQLSKEQKKSEELSIKVKELEYLIRKMTLEEGDKVKKLKEANQNLENFKSLQKLKDSPEIAEMMKMKGFEGEDLTQFSSISEGEVK